MGLRINTNVTSLVAQHRLDATAKKQGLALERLASGLRINRGADDVIGLFKSETLRAQLSGIAKALDNIGSAQNLLGVAEGSLSQLTAIAQGIREKLVQGADATISSTDRASLAASINEQLNAAAAIAQQSKFAGVALLDGTFSSKTIQAGANDGETVTFSLGDARTTGIGQIAIYTATTTVTTTAAGQIGYDSGSTTASLSLQSPTALIINGVTLLTAALAEDGASLIEGSQSAIAYANLINANAGSTGVTAKALANVLTLVVNSTGLSNTGDFLMINGVTMLSGANTAVASALVTAINATTTQTGVTATLLGVDASRLVLSAADGRNIDIKFASQSTGSITAERGGAISIGAGSASSAHVFRANVRLISDSIVAFTSGGSLFLKTASTGIALSTSFTLSTVSVGSSSNAETGIFILDNVIRQLQQRRADIGSKSLRLDATQNDLQIRQENFADSESRIRDTDVAAETANLTSAQILQQAGIQVLQRANALPQVALALLQG